METQGIFVLCNCLFLQRSGRVEEEIEMLQNKLRNIEGGTVFGGKRTKIARSQGKKIQITIEQEKSRWMLYSYSLFFLFFLLIFSAYSSIFGPLLQWFRILGNLAWAYLQQHNYGIAEQHYRYALFIFPKIIYMHHIFLREMSVYIFYIEFNSLQKSIVSGARYEQAMQPGNMLDAHEQDQ